ncbi:hypothetical protein L9F63_020243, partial [Diploptera punctata]
KATFEFNIGTEFIQMHHSTRKNTSYNKTAFNTDNDFAAPTQLPTQNFRISNQLNPVYISNILFPVGL